MKPIFKAMALLVGLSLSLPNTAFALRQTGLEESDKVKNDLLAALQSPNGPDAAVQKLMDGITRTVGLPASISPTAGLEEATPQELAALARIAQNLKGQVFRVGLEEWSRRVIDRDRNNLSIQSCLSR